MVVHRQTILENQTLILDGQEYHDCEIKHCTLIFKGQEAVKLERCILIGCRWQFEDSAMRTVALLKGLYLSGHNGKEIVQAIFEKA